MKGVGGVKDDQNMLVDLNRHKTVCHHYYLVSPGACLQVVNRDSSLVEEEEKIVVDVAMEELQPLKARK